MTHFGEIQLPGSTLKNEQNLKIPFVPGLALLHLWFAEVLSFL